MKRKLRAELVSIQLDKYSVNSVCYLESCVYDRYVDSTALKININTNVNFLSITNICAR